MDPNTESIFNDLEADAPVRYASPGQRFLNYIIDKGFLYLVLYGCGTASQLIEGLLGVNLLAFISDEHPLGKVFLYGYVYIVMVALYTLTEGLSKGKTLGKLITGTQAVKEENLEGISLKDAVMRSLCRLVPFDALSGLNGHPWHDKWTKTLVVKTR